MSCLDMTYRDKLINALKNVDSDKMNLIKQVRSEAKSFGNNEDFLWRALLQSRATYQNSREISYKIRDDPLMKFSHLKTLNNSKRNKLVASKVRDYQFRFPKKATKTLLTNFKIIAENWGDAVAASSYARGLKNRTEKIDFALQFDHISNKYARNIWMDIADPHMDQAIPIDSRIQKFIDKLGLKGNFQTLKGYLKLEGELLQIASEAGLSGWEFDRLLWWDEKDGYFLNLT